MPSKHKLTQAAKRRMQIGEFGRAITIRNTLEQNEPLAPFEIDQIDEAMTGALHRLKSGTAQIGDACSLLGCAKTCLQFESLDIESGHVDDLRAAEKALEAAIVRHEQGKSLLLDGPGIAAVTTMLDVHLAALRQCTRSTWLRVLDSTTARAAA